MKEKQRQLIIEIMKEDEKSGLYTTRKQTAVDWLVDQIENFNCMKLGLIPSDIIEEAKAREKMQIESAHRHGASDLILHRYKMEQYYKDTYGEE